MKSLAFWISFLILPIGLQAKKAVLPYELVISSADLIVEGKIKNHTDSTFTFSVSQTIKGKELSEITVKKFKQWICDTRIKPYKIGQKLLLFLEMEDGEYNTINGSTGELFCENDSVEGRNHLKQKFKLSDFKEAVNDFLICYSLKNKDIYSRQDKIIFFRNKQSSEVALLENKTKAHTFLFEKVKNYSVEDNFNN